MIYLVSYDLHSPTNNRKDVEESIKSIGEWCKPLTTTYLVSTVSSISYVSSTAKEHMDNNDSLIVCPLTKEHSATVPIEMLNWIKEHQN